MAQTTTKPKTITEEKVKSVISFLEHMAEKAHDNSEKWRGTDTTYGDTNRNASDVYCGSAEAYEHAANEIWKLIK